MSARRASFRQADAVRALRAAVSAGLKPSRYTISADGSITVNLDEDHGASSENSFDKLVGCKK